MEGRYDKDRDGQLVNDEMAFDGVMTRSGNTPLSLSPLPDRLAVQLNKRTDYSKQLTLCGIMITST